MPFFVRFPLAAVLLGDDAEGRLCVRKTPGAMGWEVRPAWAPAKAPAAVYSWSARLLLCDSGRGSGELPSCEAWLLAVLVEAGVVDPGELGGLSGRAGGWNTVPRWSALPCGLLPGPRRSQL